MNLWRRIEARNAGEDPEQIERDKSRGGSAHDRVPRVPRLDLALETSAVVARIVLDARLSFAAAVAIVLLVPGPRGQILTAALVALGAFLVYRADRLQRIPEHLRWLAWADLNKPLLRRLSLEAPGTYAHTMVIANLVEAACNAIGADGLLARVGAYYHDIGKLRKPAHFIENQSRGRNPHDKLKPSTSASIIRNHVREGLELARDNGVPPRIRAFIAEHHGTLPIAFFLEKARERDAGVSMTEYCYQGPIPQSAETAVLMLADGVEAKVRTLPDPTPTAIGEAVEAIIARRFEEGQLAQAPLTLRQLGIIRDQFVRILSGMHHGRIEYPSGKWRTLAISPSSRASA